jgi:hypothetical protein
MPFAGRCNPDDAPNAAAATCNEHGTHWIKPCQIIPPAMTARILQDDGADAENQLEEIT